MGPPRKLKRFLSKLAYAVAPKLVAQTQRFRYLRKEAANLSRLCQGIKNPDELFELVQRTPFYTQQIQGEFVSLMKVVKEARPRNILEIGSYQGGTLFLLSQMATSDARVMTIDINHLWVQRLAHRGLVSSSQKHFGITADSHHPATLDKVKEWLDGEQLDLLFIDGDHSLPGVQNDFQMYGPLVREGGMVVFHDIVADFMRRYGQKTPSDAGEVYLFWKHLKSQGLKMREFVADPNQDGFGIGVVVMPPADKASTQIANPLQAVSGSKR